MSVRVKLLRGAPADVPVTDAQGRTIVFLLMLVSLLNLMDRQILSMLLVPIQKDIAATDTQMGLLTGFAFSIFYVTASFPLAQWVDRGNRRNLIAAAIAVWSASAMGCSVIASYVQLLLLRVGVAAGEAAAQPAAFSIISDAVPQTRRATAIGVC